VTFLGVVALHGVWDASYGCAIRVSEGLGGEGWCSAGPRPPRGPGRRKLIVVQPLLVTTIVWALPLGHWLTAQNVVRRQVLGAGVVVVGLALFVLVGDPDAGVEDASTESLLIAVLSVSAVVAVLLLLLRGKAAVHAAVLGVCAGLYFGLSAGSAKRCWPRSAARS
jgi:hypothetical protein